MTRGGDDFGGDELLSGLDQMTNIIYWYQTSTSTGLRAAAALTEAIDDWIGEHAAEHHHSEPFFSSDRGDDPLAAVLAHLAAAVAALHTAGARPGLTFTEAFSEAVAGWVAAVAAEYHHSQPFQPAKSS